MSAEQRKVLVVDDQPQNVRLLQALLEAQGYAVVAASSGEAALAAVTLERPDIVLLDIVMPGIDGYEVCRRLRADPATRFLPIVMVTASPDQDKAKAVELGADDFLPKPFDKAELLARVRSLLRIKEYHDTIERQSAELAELNQTLEARVRSQVDELERLGRLRRFLSPQLAELVLSSGGDAFLEGHRREITVVAGDLSGFTALSDSTEPEEVMSVLRQYHETFGKLIIRYEGTLKDIVGDGFMVFFNDPLPCPDPAERAVRMAIAMRDRVAELCMSWRKHGHDVGFRIGITHGYATLGRIGFEGRWDYGAVGRVVNLAARLLGPAKAGQILLNPKAYALVEELVEAEPVGEIELKGFARPIPLVNVIRLKETARTPAG